MKTCRYFDCDESIPSNHVVCRYHYDDYKVDLLNDCPNCGRLKSVHYELCLSCKNKKSSAGTPKKRSKGFFGKATAVVREIIEEVGNEPKSPPKRSGNTAKKPAKSPKTSRSPWKDSETGSFYVYVMALDGGAEYYVGQTNDVRSRKLEHQQGRTKTTAGRNPQLKWFTRVRTREEAVEYERHLTKLSKAAGGRAITRMIIEFGDLVQSIDP